MILSKSLIQVCSFLICKNINSLIIVLPKHIVLSKCKVLYKYRHTSFHCTTLYCASQMFFNKLKAKPYNQQKDYDSLYCNGLELNLQYRRGIPVLLITTQACSLCILIYNYYLVGTFTNLFFSTLLNLLCTTQLSYLYLFLVLWFVTVAQNH